MNDDALVTLDEASPTAQTLSGTNWLCHVPAIARSVRCPTVAARII
ncbi:hypothetical protein [Caballeronia mineralivorans]|nr:hypothetical protein [Caballeronia mineralivorans]